MGSVVACTMTAALRSNSRKESDLLVGHRRYRKSKRAWANASRAFILHIQDKAKHSKIASQRTTLAITTGTGQCVCQLLQMSPYADRLRMWRYTQMVEVKTLLR